MGEGQLGSGLRCDLLLRAAAENNVPCRIQVGGGDGGLEVGDGWNGGLLFVAVFLVVGFIVFLGEEFGGDASAAR